MALGFDLTQFGAYPSQQKTNQPTTPAPQPQPQAQPAPIIDDPSAPKDINEALTKPLNVEVHTEEGDVFEDKLKKAPGLKKALWGIDKFAASVKPVQVTGKDGRKIWVDANGNNVLDPETGEVLTKPLPSTPEDREEINFHDGSEDVKLEITK